RRGLLRRGGAARPCHRPHRVLLRRLLLRSVRASRAALRGARARTDRTHLPPCSRARGGGRGGTRHGLPGLSGALRRAARRARSVAGRRAPRTLPWHLPSAGDRALRDRSRTRVAANDRSESRRARLIVLRTSSAAQVGRGPSRVARIARFSLLTSLPSGSDSETDRPTSTGGTHGSISMK